jgi:hypothetical protein
MTKEFPMLVLLRKRQESVVARGPNRFECPIVPVADSSGGSLTLSLEGDANDPVYRGRQRRKNAPTGGQPVQPGPPWWLRGMIA